MRETRPAQAVAGRGGDALGARHAGSRSVGFSNSAASARFLIRVAVVTRLTGLRRQAAPGAEALHDAGSTEGAEWRAARPQNRLESGGRPWCRGEGTQLESGARLSLELSFSLSLPLPFPLSINLAAYGDRFSSPPLCQTVGV